jgi:hypothetical protein
VVVDQLNVVGVPAFPSKAESPLSTDANAPLTNAIGLEFFKPIPGWHAQIHKAGRRVKDAKLSKADVLNVWPPSLDRLSVEQTGRILVAETADHEE